MIFPFLDHPGPIPFAHRGGAGDWPENTMRAFSEAVALGYQYVETDVHVTSDGVLLAFHDDDLSRVTNAAGLIQNMTYASVAKVRIQGEPIPRLEELLTAWPSLRVNIDVKHGAALVPLVECLRRTHSIARVCVGAFSDRRVAYMRRALGPELCTALGPRAVAGLRLRSALAGSAPSGIDTRSSPVAQVPIAFGPIQVISSRFVRYAHYRGMQVHAWTIDEADEMRRLLDLGVDGIMTDRLVVLKSVLQERNQWYG